MDDLPEVGLSAVIENLKQFTSAANEITKSYDEMSQAGDAVESSSGAMSSALGALGGVLSGGLVLAAAAAVAAIAGVAVAIGGVSKAAFDMASDVNDATNNIQTDLGVTEEEAEKLGEIATDIWANNFGESVNEVSDALVIAKQRFEDISDTDLQNVVQDAYMLQDAFGVDLSESLAAADVLSEKFGITTDQAMDFITKGFQKGLNSSGDFLDSITEYGGLFGQSGADAGEFFSVLETGLAGGVLGTDKAADLFKEFSLRIVDGSDSTYEALETLTTPTEDFIGQLQDGSLTVSDVFTIMKDRIADLDDPIEQQRLGVALFGTQWEDLGTKAVFAIDSSATSLKDLQGSTDTLTKQYDNLGDLFQDIWRDALVALLPLGETLLETGKEIMPLLQEAFTAIQPSIEEFASYLGENLSKAAQELIPWIQERLVPTLFDISNWIINEGIPKLVQFADWVWNELIPAIKEWYKWFKENIWPVIVDVAKVIKDDVIPAIGDFASWISDELIPAVKDIWKWIDDNLLPIFEDLFKSFSKDGKKAGGILTDIWEDISEALEPLIEEYLPELLELWDEIKDWTKRNWPKIQKIIEDVMKAIQKKIDEVLTWLEDFWEDWGETILAVIERTFGFIVRTIKRNVEIFMDIIELALDVLTGDWEGAWQKVLDITQRIGEQIKDLISTIFGNIKDIVANALKLLIENVSTKLSQLKSNIESKFNEIKTKIQEIWNTIKTNVIEAIKSMMESIVSTIGNWATSISNKLNEVVSGAVSALLNAVSSGNIASLLSSVGQKMIEIISNAFSTVTTFAEKLRTALSDAVQKIIDDFGTLGTTLKNLATSIIAKIGAYLTLAWDTLKTYLQTTLSAAVGSVWSGATSLLNSIKSIGSTIVTNIGSAISSNFYKIKSKLKDVVEDLVKEALSWLGISSPSNLMYDMGVNMAKGMALGLQDGASLINSGLANLVSAPLIPAPISAASAAGQSISNQTFNLGGNTISSGMDAATFEARVIDVVRRNS